MKKKIIKWVIVIAVAGLVIAGSIVIYIFNMPHRDVQSADIDFSKSATELVQEYLDNPQTANDKYLQEDGESKIIAVSGMVSALDEDMNQQKVVLLKSPDANAGVSCTFTAITNVNASTLKPGDLVTIKGVIRSGAGFDEDLEMYEDVILEKCDIINE